MEKREFAHNITIGKLQDKSIELHLENHGLATNTHQTHSPYDQRLWLETSAKASVSLGVISSLDEGWILKRD